MSVKEFRAEIGGDILIAMLGNEEFPIANKHRLAKTMQEYFYTEGFQDVVAERGYRWEPSVDYWETHLNEVRRFLRHNKRLFLQYVRDNKDGEFTGSWQFTRKGAYEEVMEHWRAELETRLENYNDEAEAGHANPRWKKLTTAYINHTAELPAVTNAG